MSTSAKSRKAAGGLAGAVDGESDEQADTSAFEKEPLLPFSQHRSLVKDAGGEVRDLVETYYDIGGGRVLCTVVSLHRLSEADEDDGRRLVRYAGSVIFANRPDRLH